MIVLLPRADCFARHPVLARDVRALQDAFDPERDYNRGPDGEVDPDQAAWFASFRDEIEAVGGSPRAKALTLGADAADADGYPAALADALGRMLDGVGADAWIFLLAGRSARWISPLEDARVRRANDVFRALGAGEGFNGGIVAERGSLAEVVRAVFWCARLDPGYGYVYLAPRGAPLAATLCQYGNLHVSVYGPGELERTADAARAAGFTEEESCEERFGTGGAIEGRTLRMD